MSLFDVINASSTGMVANRYWLDIVAGNIANANTTRTAEGVPYRHGSRNGSPARAWR
jgi:flagellar basal-body rod protein FlgC